MAAPEAVEKQSPQISFFIVESFAYNHSLLNVSTLLRRILKTSRCGGRFVEIAYSQVDDDSGVDFRSFPRPPLPRHHDVEALSRHQVV